MRVTALRMQFPSEAAARFKTDLLDQARRRGFTPAGIAPATAAETEAAFHEWLAEGRHGEMAYMADRPERRTQPRTLWPECGSVLVVGKSYRWSAQDDPRVDGPTRGRVARYAQGDDYHEVLRKDLTALRLWSERTKGVHGRVYIDSGPLLERDLAARAGLGWFGKNTMLLDRRHGSYFFLGALLLNVALTPDAPASAHCGTCRRCLDVCPTGAFVGPHVLDARRCISYLTIELRGPIPRELRPLIGNWIFGCDLCQEVCPWNRKAAFGDDPRLAPRAGLTAPELIPLLRLTEPQFRARFRKSAVRRATYGMFLRNVCVALGNSGDPSAVPALLGGLRHQEELVRGHSAWALAALGGAAFADHLRRARNAETVQWVVEEMSIGLSELGDPGCSRQRRLGW
jgi:epoxyqueuosine reductase